jgi:beta-lactamase class A
MAAGLLLAFLAWRYISFRNSLQVMPPETTMGGVDIGGMAPTDALDMLEFELAQAVEAYYQDQMRTLTPESVEFRLDQEATLAAIDDALSDRRGIRGFLRYLIQSSPDTPLDIPIVSTYSAERLDGFLASVGQQYDHPPQPPVPLPDALTFRAGRPGYQLDREASHEAIATALVSAADRQVELVVNQEDAPPLEIAQLNEMLGALLEDFGGIPSLFVKDLQTGTELEINPDVAYAGMSLLKIAVMAESYRYLDQAPNIEQTKLLTETMTLSGNFTANLLLRDVIGNGDGYQGVEALTASMRYLGLVNTFMATPYDEEVVPPTIVTPANSRTDVTTQPDPYMQTTARDMGLLLEMLYQCSHGGGALMVAYPGAFTVEECQEGLEMMTENVIGSLIEAGVPEGTSVAHKHGWIGDTHADAAIVFSPGGDFVLTVFLYYPGWLEWDLSNPLISDIATATYNYFNPAE